MAFFHRTRQAGAATAWAAGDDFQIHAQLRADLGVSGRDRESHGCTAGAVQARGGRKKNQGGEGLFTRQEAERATAV